MKKFLPFLLFAATLHAQTTPVTGTIQGASGVPAGPNSYVEFTLVNCGTAQPMVGGVAVMLNAPVDFYPDANGNLVKQDGSAASLYGNDIIQCMGSGGSIGNTSRYSVSQFPNGQPAGPTKFYYVQSGVNFNLNTAQPIFILPPLKYPNPTTCPPGQVNVGMNNDLSIKCANLPDGASNAVVVNPAGNQNIVQPSGTSLSVTGDFSATRITGTASGNLALNSVSSQTVNQPKDTNVSFDFTGDYVTGSYVKEFSALSDGADPASLAQGSLASITGAVNVPSSSTAHQAEGVYGFTSNNSTSTNAVGGYFVGSCIAPGTSCWGSNPLVSDSPGNAGTLFGEEIDVNVNNATTFGQALLINGAWSVQPGDMNAIDVDKPVGGTGNGFSWGVGLHFQTGATNGAAILIDPQGQPFTGSVPSQVLEFDAFNSGGIAQPLKIFEDGDSNLNIDLSTGLKVNVLSDADVDTPGGFITSGTAGSSSVVGSSMFQDAIAINRDAHKLTNFNPNGFAYQLQHGAYSTTANQDTLSMTVYNPSGGVAATAFSIFGNGSMNIGSIAGCPNLFCVNGAGFTPVFEGTSTATTSAKIYNATCITSAGACAVTLPTGMFTSVPMHQLTMDFTGNVPGTDPGHCWIQSASVSSIAIACSATTTGLANITAIGQ